MHSSAYSTFVIAMPNHLCVFRLFSKNLLLVIACRFFFLIFSATLTATVLIESVIFASKVSTGSFMFCSCVLNYCLCVLKD